LKTIPKYSTIQTAGFSYRLYIHFIALQIQFVDDLLILDEPNFYYFENSFHPVAGGGGGAGFCPAGGGGEPGTEPGTAGRAVVTEAFGGFGAYCCDGG